MDLDEPSQKKPTKFPEFPGAEDLDEPPPSEVIDLASTDEENDDTEIETETEDDDNADTEPYGNLGGNKLKF